MGLPPSIDAAGASASTPANGSIDPGVLPGDPAYRKALPGGLAIRWSTPDDRPGIALTSALALGLPEGFESEFFVRIPERLASDDYWFGDSRGWAICIATTGPRHFPCGKSLDEGVVQEEPYVASIRAAASDAPEPVLAVVSYSLMEWRIEGHSVKAVKHTIVACRPGFRARDGTQVMKYLFEMIMSRMQMTGVAFSAASGIPNYYRRHGYELGIRYGPGFTTFCCSLPPSLSADDTITLREATVHDTDALVELDRRNSNASSLCASVSDEVLRKEYEWSLGDRGPGYEGDAHRHVPAFVLEKGGKIIAGFFYYGHPFVARPTDCKVMIRRIVFDPEADLWALADELPAKVIEATQRLAEEEIVFLGRAAGEQVDEDALRAAAKQAQVARINWHVSEGHPLLQHMVRNRFARKDDSGVSYLFSSDWWVAIPSLPTFCSALAPVLNARMSTASKGLGSAYAGVLRICTYESAFPGVVIKASVANGVQIEERSFTRDAILYAPGTKAELPNVIAPRGSLIQLLMGYRSLEELRIATPDLSATDDAAVLLKVLFPKVEESVMHTYAW